VQSNDGIEWCAEIGIRTPARPYRRAHDTIVQSSHGSILDVIASALPDGRHRVKELAWTDPASAHRRRCSCRWTRQVRRIGNQAAERGPQGPRPARQWGDSGACRVRAWVRVPSEASRS